MKIKNQEIKHGCNIIKTTLELFLILLGFGLASLFVPGSNSGFHIALWNSTLSVLLHLWYHTDQNWMRCYTQKAEAG